MSAAALRIVVCNDDGAGSPGLPLLAQVAHGLTRDVWTVAPARKWTAASHQVTFDRDLTLTRCTPRDYVCDGGPADCVIAAMTLLSADHARPDLVLAGINDQPNVGEDVAYSGTLAIAREATFWGVPAIAFSRSGRWTDTAPEVAALRRLLAELWTTRDAWSADGHWLAVSLPHRLPARVAQPRIARDKLAGAVDLIDHDAARWVYRTRRGRPGSRVPGDENDTLRVAQVSIVRHGWRDAAAMPEPWLARVAAAVAEDDPVA